MRSCCITWKEIWDKWYYFFVKTTNNFRFPRWSKEVIIKRWRRHMRRRVLYTVDLVLPLKFCWVEYHTDISIYMKYQMTLLIYVSLLLVFHTHVAHPVYGILNVLWNSISIYRSVSLKLHIYSNTHPHVTETDIPFRFLRTIGKIFPVTIYMRLYYCIIKCLR